MNLPKFRYHVDPVGNGVIKESDATCVCCGKQRGYIYIGPVYATEDLEESICPWCIANGEAAKKYDAEFSDSHPLLSSGISREIAEEVTQRNPGYFSWQQECWLSHCNDACEYYGDASEDDVINASEATKQQWMLDNDADEKFWATVTKGYHPKGGVAFYKFKCRHCSLTLLGWDCS